MLVDGSVWAWGRYSSGHGNSPARVEAYGADTAMRFHGCPMGSVFVVLADGTAMRDGAAVAELGGGIVEIAHTSSHILVLKGGEDMGRHLGLLCNYFPGFGVEFFPGSFVGAGYGFLVGYVTGRVLCGVYNLVAR